MKLVYEATGEPVRLGEITRTSKGERVRVMYFVPPHKPSSEGKVSVRHLDGTRGIGESEYYVSVIGAKWV